jgi:antitoxin component of MazEF toxin-antitoxin module
MKTRLMRVDEGAVLVLDRPLLEKLGLDDDAEVELTTDGHVLTVTPLHRAELRTILDEMDEQYAGVFRKLAE